MAAKKKPKATAPKEEKHNFLLGEIMDCCAAALPKEADREFGEMGEKSRLIKLEIKYDGRSELREKIEKCLTSKGIKHEAKIYSGSRFAGTQVKFPQSPETFAIRYRPKNKTKVSTAVAESAQCLYAALAMNVVNGDIGNNTSKQKLEEAWKSCHCGGTTYAQIDKQLSDEWVDSSIIGGNTLRNHYSTVRDFEFHRDSPKVKDIADTFYRLKRNDPELNIDINKWSPADIYLIKRGFNVKTALAPVRDVKTFNYRMYVLLKQKKVIGVSLKKISGNTLTPITSQRGDLKDVNFPNGTSKPIDITFEGIASPPFSTSGYINFKKGTQKMSINLRNFTASGGFSGEVLQPGSPARHGKVSHGPLNEQLKKHNLKDIPSNIPGRAAALNEAKWMADMMKKLDKNGSFLGGNTVEAMERNIKANTDINYISSKYFVLKVFESILPILNNPELMDSLTETLFRYAGSRIKTLGGKQISGPYLKLM